MLIQADALYLPYPSNYFHAVCTSPPYWGLRKYSGEQGRVWGGDPDCEHEWGEVKQPTVNKPKERPELPNPPASWSTRDATAKPGHGGFCQKCNAWYGGLGLEPTPELHIQNMVEIFREVWRVLRPDGVVWLNYGDCYGGSGGGHKDNTGQSGLGFSSWEAERGVQSPKSMMAGNLMLMPHRLAIALQADGWIVRNDLVWFKRNPMPESVSGWKWEKHRIKTKRSKHATEHNIKGGTEAMLRDASIHQGISEDWLPDYVDCPGCEKCEKNDGLVLRKSSWRHTRAHEYVFQLVKKMGYFCNQEAVREPSKPESYDRTLRGVGKGHKHINGAPGQVPHSIHAHRRHGDGYKVPSGRNPRSVLDVPTAPYKGSHYATFPPNLIAPLIRASVPRRCCPECGMAWAPVVEKQQTGDMRWSERGGTHRADAPGAEVSPTSVFRTGSWNKSNVTDYRPSCECGHEEHEPGIVLDIFGGSGTTGMVAKQLLRRWVVMDISRPYLDEQAKIRTGTGSPSKALEGLPMFEETE